MTTFPFGMEATVQHRDTAYVGSIICRAEYRSHNTYLVRASELVDGKIVDQWIDEGELIGTE